MNHFRVQPLREGAQIPLGIDNWSFLLERQLT
jgi:hypothetical protein